MPKTYRNPVIPGFYPDPSICRVEDDYYMVTSTFEFFPGVPIFHSKDMVNWKQIGHVLDRPSQLDLDGVSNSAGIYAPTIRYHEGTFYMVTTVAAAYGTHTNFYCSTKDPAGDWSEPFVLKDAPGIDPSFIFVDGKMIYCGNGKPELIGSEIKSEWEHHRNIWAREIVPETGEELGEKRTIINTADWTDQYGQEKCNAWEAPHIYEKDGWFYLMVASGGTGWGHSQYMFRSKDPFGPYTEACPHNPIMTHRHIPQETSAIHCTGHGDFVQTQNGEWWIVFLASRPYAGMRNYLGRETMMAPVDWSGDWPVVGDGSRTIAVEYPRPDLPAAPVDPVPVRDDFDADMLGDVWNVIRTPREQWWSLTDKPGHLRINARPEKFTEQVQPSFVGQRVCDLAFSSSTVVDFTPQSDEEEAGMVLYKNTSTHFRLVVRKGPRRNEFGEMIDGKGHDRCVYLYKRLRFDDRDSLLAEVPVPEGAVYLRIDTNDRCYRFSYRLDGMDWTVLDNSFDVSWLSQVMCGGFVGIYTGMYAGCPDGESTNFADFDWFEYEGRDK